MSATAPTNAQTPTCAHCGCLIQGGFYVTELPHTHAGPREYRFWHQECLETQAELVTDDDHDEHRG